MNLAELRRECQRTISELQRHSLDMQQSIERERATQENHALQRRSIALAIVKGERSEDEDRKLVAAIGDSKRRVEVLEAALVSNGREIDSKKREDQRLCSEEADIENRQINEEARWRRTAEGQRQMARQMARR